MRLNIGRGRDVREGEWAATWFILNLGLKVNLGCGRDIREGWVNVDRYDRPGVDVVADVERGLPFADGEVDYILASHVLEHLFDLSKARAELARILRPGGILEIRVPFGLKGLFNPSHLHAFNLTSFEGWWRDTVCFQDGADFEKVRIEVQRVIPFEWHVKEYLPRLHRRIYDRLPRDDRGVIISPFRRIGVKAELHLWLRRRTIQRDGGCESVRGGDTRSTDVGAAPRPPNGSVDASGTAKTAAPLTPSVQADVTCPQCGLPWAMHPVDPGTKEFYCTEFMVREGGDPGT